MFILPAQGNMTFGCYNQVTNNLLVLDYTTEWWLMTQKDIMTYVMEVWSWPWPRISTWYSWALLTFYDSWGPIQCAGFIRFCWWLLQPAKADKVHGYAGLVVTYHAGSSRCFRGICLSPLIMDSHLLLRSLLSQMCWPFSQEELITQMQPRHKAHVKEEQGPSWVWVMFSEIKSFKSKQKDNLVSGFLTASMEERGWEQHLFQSMLESPLGEACSPGWQVPLCSRCVSSIPPEDGEGVQERGAGCKGSSGALGTL